MFRRSRFNVRPNVGGAGRTASSQDAVPASQETKETTKDVDESLAASVVTDSKLVDASVAETPTVSDGNDPSGDGSISLTALQRRKRFSIKPRVAPGRLTALPRTPKSPAKVGSESPPTNSNLEPQIETQAVPPGAQSPMSPESEQEPQPQQKPEPVLVCYDGSGQAAAVSADHSPKGTKKTEKTLAPLDDCLIKVPYRAPDKVALPDKEAAALSEKAKTLLSSKSRKSSIPRFSLSRLLNDPSDIQRMEKAQKLRDMLRQEMRNEKNAKRAKRKHDMEFNLDPSKMTMRDLIRYLPLSNPMSSSVEDGGTLENETVVPFSPRREKLPKIVQKLESEVVPTAGSQAEEEQEEEAAAAEEDDGEDEALTVPRVKVAEDGTLILDEESLTVEVQRAKGPNPAEDRDPIFERGSTTTYSSFRASTYCKPWTREETDMFFLAISMVGTDFSMIGQLFHNRTRAEIRVCQGEKCCDYFWGYVMINVDVYCVCVRVCLCTRARAFVFICVRLNLQNKFKKEERQNSWRIDKAFRERRKLDIEYFSKLLMKILEVQANRKKLKSLVVKNVYKKRQRSSKRATSKEFVDEVFDSEEGQEEEEDEIDVFSSSDTEDGEKENDNICKDGRSPVSKARKKRKGQSAENDSAATLKKTKSNAGEKSGEEDDTCTPEATGAPLPQDQPNSEVAAKPVLPLGRKWSKKLPPGSTTAKAEDNASATEDASVASEASREQMNKATTPPRGVSEEENGDGDDGSEGGLSSGGEDFSAKPPKPTRYGRIPKPRSVLNYPAKEEGPTSKSERKCTSKRNRSTTAPSAAPASKKSKLITLRASQSESSEDEEEQVQQRDDGVFVPACLRSPSIVIPQVDETMEELDILGNMSTVLDISQDTLCPDSLCVGDKSETEVPEACVHQLDLLVDVIDLLSTEHTEVSEVESYNEAAQTLLAIGNMSQLSQSETMPDQRTETDSESVTETNTFLEEEIAEFIKENGSSPIPFTSTDHGVTETIEAPISAPSLQRTVSGPDSSPPVHSSPPTSRGSSSKVKPKPNLTAASRTTHSKCQPDVSPVESPVECCNPAPILSQETIPMEEEFYQASKRQTCDLESAGTEAKFTDAESGHNYVATSYVAVTEPQTDKSNALLPQGSGDHDAARQDILKCQKLSDSQETRCRLPKVKPKPNLSQISRRARCIPQTAEETSLLSTLESTLKTTAGAEPQPASLETPGHSTSSASNVTPIMNLSDRMIQSNELTSNEEKVVSVGHVADDTTSTDADAVERGHNAKAAPQSGAEVSKTHVVQEGGEFHTAMREESKEPQPACPLSPGTSTQSASTASNAASGMNVSSVMILLEELTPGEDTTLGDGLAMGETKSTDAGHTNETAEFTELETEESKNALEQESGDYDKDLLARQKESEVVFAKQTRRSRFPKVKPNLLQTSRNAQGTRQNAKEMSQSLNLESPCKKATEVRPQPTGQISTSASTVTAVLSDTGEILSEELTPHEQKKPGFTPGNTKPTGFETVESGRNNEATSDAAVTEPQTKKLNKPLDQKDGDHGSSLQELPKGQKSTQIVSRRSRFPKIKPNLSQISRSSLSKCQTTKESSTFSDLESTCKTTAEVKSQPTCSFSIQNPSQSVSSPSTVMPVNDLRPTLRPSEQIASSEEMGTGLGPAARDTKSTDGNVVESGRDHEAASQSTSETCQNVTSGARTSSPDGTNQEYSEASNHTREAIQRHRRLPKVKPNLRSPARATQSTSQSRDGLDKPSNVTSDCQSVSASPQCASSEVGSTKTSDLSIIEGESSETPAVGEETASNVALHLERVMATSISLNPTTDCPSLNITPPDSFRESSRTTEAKAETPKCTEDTLLTSTSTMKRSRPVKPQPNVGRGARQSRQVAVTTGSATSGPRGQTTVLLTPVEGAKEQVKSVSSASTSEAPEPECHIQDDSASVSGANQTSANLSVFPDTLSVPSDPDEPFFILSLMEVPLDESSHQPPQADLTVQHSHPVDSAVAGTDCTAPGVLSGEMGVTKSAVTEHPVLPAPPAGSEDTTASAVLSSPQRRPKGFLSFLTRTSSAGHSESSRGKAASRRPNVSKPVPRKRPTAPTAAPQPATTEQKVESKPLTSCIMPSQPSPRPSGSSTQVSACQHGSSVSVVQEQPTNVSQYFLSDIFTEVNET
ncbi:transcription factor TFIIIB component B'' homolog isoform X2 [Hippocampus zosterae]|uniref:transcription factor TFIIIB component B'' homolog isoform X2 n=1 Tax=Hippocampus zosterae TaxID=109293 RepID=UPI00223C9722|nr:transcription factor TFIIIB component B'' homolog isoform X2 [Hippocampus zosterae]